MTSDHHDWQLAIRDRLRQQVVPMVLAGLLLTYFGWTGGWALPAGGIQRAASVLYIAAFKIGGPVFLALAAVSWSGWRVWLLADGAVGLAVAAAFGLYGFVSLATGALGINAVLSIVFAVMFGSSAMYAVNLFRASAGVPLFGGTKPVASAGPAPPPRNATPYEGQSLAGELLKRSRGMPQEPADLPVARAAEPRRGVESPPVSVTPPTIDPPPSRPTPAPPKPAASESSPAPMATPAPSSLPKAAPPSAPPAEAPDGFLAALAREDEEDDTSRG
jgi:hypothetical protein